MSLTGPRPCLPSEAKLYDANQLRRFQVLPGLTGSWQVKRNESTTFRDMVAMDDEYVDRLSPAGDLTIIFRTPFVLLGQVKRYTKAPFRIFGVPSDSVRTTFADSRPIYSVAMTKTQKFSD